ncbi:hypothetical protein, partial [Raoultella terrigena]|uniref:hypothetical protein n=1 Tax=Raoultella terrigena TaxID=577 RepID=UPI0015F2E322
MIRRCFLHRVLLRAGGRCIARRGALPASTVVLAVGLLAAAAALTGALVVSLGDLRGAFATSESQAQLLARVLEDQTTRTFEAGEM